MFLTKRFNLGLVLMLFCLFLLSACGPSPEDLAATSAAETAAAATSTPTITPTFTPTPTQTPTPKPTPVPDAGTMIDIEKLDLPSSYTATSPDDYGFPKGALLGEIDNQDLYIENSFAFRDNRGEVVYGISVNLPKNSDIDAFFEMYSSSLDEAKEIYASGGATVLGGSIIQGAENIGEKSSGVRVEYVYQSMNIITDEVTFRIGNIIAGVTVKNYQGTEPSISAVEVAEVYASSIQNPISSCQLKKVTPVEGASWPLYDYQAEGFYPGESLIVMIEGKAQLENEPILVGYVDGVGDESAVIRVMEEKVLSRGFGLFGFRKVSVKVDNNGQVDGTIMLSAIAGGDVVPPKDITLSIFGLYSGCEIEETVTWPGDSEASDPVTTNNQETTSLPTPDNAQLFAGSWHRNGGSGDNPGVHQVNYCQNGEVWVCNFKNLPEPELGFDCSDEVSGVFEGTPILDWNCPSWFPENICENNVFVIGGSTDFTGGTGGDLHVDIEYIVIETVNRYVLYEYWVNRFVCPWYRTFDEVLEANPLQNRHNDCFFP